MPVYKFKSFEEAQVALWTFKPDQVYYRRLSQLWDLAATLCPPRFPHGIFKFRTMAEANAHRRQVELSNALNKTIPGKRSGTIFQ